MTRFGPFSPISHDTAGKPCAHPRPAPLLPSPLTPALCVSLCLGPHADAGKQKSAKATAALPTVKVVSGEGEEASTSDAFDAGMEALAEKRNKVKEEGLRRVCTALRASVLSAHVEPRCGARSQPPRPPAPFRTL